MKRLQGLIDWLTTPLKHRPRWLKPTSPVVLVLITTTIAGAVWLVVRFPQQQTSCLKERVEDYRTKTARPDLEKPATLEKGLIDSENAIRAAIVQGLGGAVLLVGLYLTYQTLRATRDNIRVAEDKQVTERFGKAVDMLSHDSMHTRLGGIYALERIAIARSRPSFVFRKKVFCHKCFSFKGA